MNLLPLSRIQIAANRQRKEFDELSLQELVESIEANGLLHAPVLRKEGDSFFLVAGERRLRALADVHALGKVLRYDSQIIPEGLIPYTDLGELAPLAAMEAEMEENLRRVDLTWQERAAARAALVALRNAQADEAERPRPTILEIAAEVRGLPADTPREALGFTPQEVREDVILSKFLDDPEVRGASTAKNAIKVLKRKEEAQRNASLAATVGLTFSSKSHTLLNEDSLDWMRAAPPAQFDIILTDPPYGMGADEFGSTDDGAARAHSYKDDYETWLAIMRVFPKATYALTKPDAHAYVFCDFDRFHELLMRMTEAGWRVHRTPLIWSNPSGFRAPWPEQGVQRKYELILYAVKGGKKVRALKGDVLEFPKDRDVAHQAAKPVALLEELLRRSASPGDRVLDPFMGSGSTVLACHTHKLPCVGLELDLSSFGLAVKRVSALSAYDEGLF
jgi:DNA modification methylase/ParB-like chromosome segregation protein Spo0J